MARHAASLNLRSGRFQLARRTWLDKGTSFSPSVLAFYPAARRPDSGDVLGSGQDGYVAERVGSDRDDVRVEPGRQPAALGRLRSERQWRRRGRRLDRLKRSHAELDHVHDLGAVAAPRVGP